ncbi:hypothetical protein ACFL3G_10305 [Planctomycetota bacterium]
MRSNEDRQNEFVFPLLMHGSVIEKGDGRVILPHRADGEVCGKGTMGFSQAKGGIEVSLGEKTVKNLLKTGGERLFSLKSREIKSALKKAAELGKIEVELVSDATYTCKLLTGRKNLLQVNRKFFELLSGDDSVLAAFVLAFVAFSLATGQERRAIRKLFVLFGQVSQGVRDELAKTLGKQGVDFKGLLLETLQQAQQTEVSHELERLVSILQVRQLVDIPYDTQKVDTAGIQFEEDLAELRNGMLKVIGDSYVPAIDADNAQRVADHCIENDVRLMVCRFGRAFYTDGLLIADGKTVEPGDIEKSVKKLTTAFGKLNVSISNAKLHKYAEQLNLFGAQLQRINNLMSAGQIPEAKLIGIIISMQTELRNFENDLLKKFDKTRSETIHSQLAPEVKKKNIATLDKEARNVRKQIAGVLESISDFEIDLGQAPKTKPVFASFISRIHELDAINIAKVNQVVDPFFGENEALNDVISSAGENVYITPNHTAWLCKAHDWVEALPAFAHYNIIPDEVGTGYSVTSTTEREILEIIYKSYADCWALNIKDVMALENVALAQQLVAGGAIAEKAIDAQEQEKMRQICISKGLGSETARLAAVIAKIAEKDVDLISKAIADSDFTFKRYEALCQILSSHKKLGRQGAAIKVTKKQIEAYLPLALKKRRELPNIHVLTTLGPTETEVNIANWIEEGMQLYNICTEKNLGDEVGQLISKYQKRVASAAEIIAEEQEMEGELLRILAENNMDQANPAHRKRALFQLLGMYPEISADTVNLAVLQDNFETDGSIPAVKEYIKTHGQLRKTAREIVAANNNLSAQIREKMADGADFDKAYEELTKADYDTEESSILYSLARKELIGELGIGKKIDMSHYLRDRIGPLSVFTARREVVAKMGLRDELYSPNYTYSASGVNKRFNLMYTPSRVDLGPEIIESVRNIPKWVGGYGRDAAQAGKSLYEIFNVAGVTAVNSPRHAEFMKVGENFFTRGGVYYLSMTAASNIDTLGDGDFEFFQGQWNKRGDRMVLPTGETYGGFCVPKEFSLLFAIITRAMDPESSSEIMDMFGVPRDAKLRSELAGDIARVLAMRTDPENDPEWEAAATEYLLGKYEEYFGFLKEDGNYLNRLPALALTLRKSGVLKAQDNSQGQADYDITHWKNTKALGLEEINRSGVFDKVRLIYKLLEKARQYNSDIAADENLIGVMAAGYKEDVTDVRFSAGARKFEIYGGTGFEHLLCDIDPKGRKVYLDAFKNWKSPQDIRMVGLCTAKDLFGHVPMNFKPIADEGLKILRGAGLDEMWIGENLTEHGVDLEGWSWDEAPDADKEELIAGIGHKVIFMAFGYNLLQIVEGVKKMLIPHGFTEEIIRANSESYGGALDKWTIIKTMPKAQRESLVLAIGPAIHILVLSYRDIINKANYEQALTGVDFIDLGIPDKEMLDLIDNLPKLLYLMKSSRENSALVFADGTSGGRRRTFSMRHTDSKEKVKELFALDEMSVYGCHGLGQATVDSWRKEMESDRELARSFMAAVLEDRKEDAIEAYQETIAYLERNTRQDEAIDLESKARLLDLWRPAYRYISKALGQAVHGGELAGFDFATWLICGGRYLVNGKMSEEEFGRLRKDYETALAKIAGLKKISATLGKDESAAVIEYMIKPRYVVPQRVFREQKTGVAGSLKATEELTLQLESRVIRRRQTEEALALEQRRNGFNNIVGDVRDLTAKFDFEKLYALGEKQVGDGKKMVEQEPFGRYLHCAKGAFQSMVRRAVDLDALTKAEIENELDIVFKGGILLDSEYRALAERIGRLFEAYENDTVGFAHCGKLAEMLDKCLVIDRSFNMYEARDAWVNMAGFFDLTINNHIFDYYPYHYHAERTPAFKDYQKWSRNAIFELARSNHLWLYRFTRMILETKTELAERGKQYCSLWFGQVADDGTVKKAAMGLEGVTDEDELFWFSYARLRDTTVIIHDGYMLPQIFDDFDPAMMGNRANVGIIFPVGNTTVAVALEQNVKLMKQDGVNVVLSPFPQVKEAKGGNHVTLPFAYFFMDEKSYEKALAKSGKATALPLASAKTEYGVLVAVRFTKPIDAHALWFHFTHYLRDAVAKAAMPIIQPLLWEAATYLKCVLPETLKGSDVICPDQMSWFKSDTDKMAQAKATGQIRKKLIKLAGVHNALIVKAEKESGGRRALILSTIDENNNFIDEHIDKLIETVYDISRTDNVVVQEVVPCQTRRLYTKEFLEMLTDRFIQELGLSVTETTPLFNYFRTIVSKRISGKYDITHRITVVSTAGVANVGQGGRLFEYRDEKIEPRYRKELWEGMKKASIDSMAKQQEYLEKNRKYIIDSYLEVHQEFAHARDELLKPHTNLLGRPDSEICYEMGDYMPFFLLDDDDMIEKVYDSKSEKVIELYDRNGKVNPDVKLFLNGKAIKLVDKKGVVKRVSYFNDKQKPCGIEFTYKKGKRQKTKSLIVMKIEQNPGAGLWRPHVDRCRLVPREDEGCYLVFRNLGEWARKYREIYRK